MRCDIVFLTFLLSTLSIPGVSGQQNFIPSTPSSTFPACGLSCQQLLAAQGSCLPPAAPVTNQQTYNSCFCQSGLLVPWKTSPNGVCDAFCTNPQDLQALQNWYNGFCANQGQVANQPTTAVSTASGSTSTSTATSDSDSSASSSDDSDSEHKGWFANHWRWVLMVILLAILLPAVAFIAIWFKRRSRRKREAEQLAHNGGLPPATESEYRHHNFFGGKWFSRDHHPNQSSDDTEQPRTREFGNSAFSLGRSGTSGTMTSVAGRTEMWGPHQGTAHTRGLGDFSQEDLRGSTTSRSGLGEKSAEAAGAKRASTSAGEHSTRPGTGGSRRDRKRLSSRSVRRNGKGKERTEDHIWEDEAEASFNSDRRQKRRSRSYRERREKDVEADTASRFSM